MVKTAKVGIIVAENPGPLYMGLILFLWKRIKWWYDRMRYLIHKEWQDLPVVEKQSRHYPNHHENGNNFHLSLVQIRWQNQSWCGKHEKLFHCIRQDSAHYRSLLLMSWVKRVPCCSRPFVHHVLKQTDHYWNVPNERLRYFTIMHLCSSPTWCRAPPQISYAVARYIPTDQKRWKGGAHPMANNCMKTTA